jgi:hypothetical protein
MWTLLVQTKHLVTSVTVTGLSPRRTGFAPGSDHVGFVVGKVALGQVLLRVHLFSPVNIIPPRLSKLIYHKGGEQ